MKFAKFLITSILKNVRKRMLLYETINLQQCFPIESPRSYLDLLSTVHAKSQVYEGAHELLCLYVFDKDLIG